MATLSDIAQMIGNARQATNDFGAALGFDPRAAQEMYQRDFSIRNLPETVLANAQAQAKQAETRELERQQQVAQQLPAILQNARDMGKTPAEVWEMLVPVVGAQDAYRYAQAMQELNAPQVPNTQGLPAGYAWSEDGTAVRIPGIEEEPQKPLSREGKLRADLEAGLISQEEYDAAAELGKGEFKQFELEAAGYGARMSDALGAIEQLEQSGKDYYSETGAFLDSLGLDTAANVLGRNETQQSYQNAADEWIRAKLRKESGAVIGEEEMAREYRTYFPQRGDSAKVIEQKRKMRQKATEVMKKQSGGAFEELYAGGAQESVGAVDPRVQQALDAGYTMEEIEAYLGGQ